ncbi:Cadherin-23 [Fasciola gigantica]|uniref:Cadherin-23 n=1 Tax=Fasciola gigantica TaxID=46835 RepID=A0A504YK19_FASGI|nr:Cadherin-23 [Fasciola gigantica]
MVLMVKGMCNSQSLFSISLCIYIFLLLVYGDGSFHAEVVEESPVGTMIHGVAEFLNELKSEADVQYQLLGDDGVSRLLSLHPTTGQLRVRARIDRESLCPSANSNPNHNSMLQATGNPDLFAGATLLSPKLENSQGVIECVQTLNILLVPRTKEATGPSGLSAGLIDGTPRTSRILIHLVIRDINDNAPMWTQGSSLEIGFVETPNADFSWSPLGSNAVVSGPGTSSNNMDDSTAKNARTIDRAVDLDLGLNSTIIYRLLGPGAEYFRLDDSAQPNLDEVKLASKHPGYISHTSAATMRTRPLQIRPIVPLDRETEDFSGRGGLFNLTLLATDMGLPPKTGSVILLIHVIDVNDHVPVFHNDLYQHGNGLGGLGRLNRVDAGLVVYRPSSGTIRETVPIGSLIVQLNATDKDVGLHAKLVYDFCPCDRSAAMEYFRVDHDTGRIGVIKPLDYDLGPRQFQFKVSLS